ncbi:MAG: hypothetical protein HRF51_11020 [bacterium]|jgi:hypothetical protein
MKVKFLIILMALSIAVSGQQATLPPGIYYEGGIYQVNINPPKGWKFDLENPRIDGRSAACFPSDQEYYNNKAMIIVWIYKLDSLTFCEFISRDSISYLKKSSSLQFKKKDSLKIVEEREVIVLETSDPGGKSSMASVAYIDVGSEILIFELNIAGRIEYAEGQTRLMEMVEKVELTEIKSDSNE